MSQGHNPYQPPKQSGPVYVAQVANNQGIWRDGKLLVMSKNATLPDICVKSNTPAKVKLKRRLYWHHPAVYLAILFNLLVYAVLAIVLRKQATIYVGLSDASIKRRWRAIAITWTLALSGIGMFIGGLIASSKNNGNTPLALLMVAGMALFLVSLLLAIFTTRVVTPHKIDDEYVWLKGVHPDFLARYPDLTSMQ